MSWGTGSESSLAVLVVATPMMIEMIVTLVGSYICERQALPTILFIVWTVIDTEVR